MAKSLKTRGLDELLILKRRVNRQLGLGRISVVDADFLIEHVNEIEARIISMNEKNEDGEEEW